MKERKREGAQPIGTALQPIMTRPPITVTPETSLADAAEIMLDRGVGSLIVVDAGGELVGIVTDSDFAARRAGIPFSTLHRPQVLGEWLGEEGVERVFREARRRTVGEVMSAHVHAVGSDDTVERVLHLMLDRNIKHVPIVDDGRPVGMVARHDLLKMLMRALPGAGSSEPGEGA